MQPACTTCARFMSYGRGSLLFCITSKLDTLCDSFDRDIISVGCVCVSVCVCCGVNMGGLQEIMS